MSAEIYQAIGHLQGTVAAQRKEYMGHILMLHRKMTTGNGSSHGGRRIPWLQIAAMGTIALSSLLALLKPDSAASLIVLVIRALVRELLH